MDKKCIVAGAGDFFETSLPLNENDLLISADGGLDSLLKIGITPHIFIGDRDSSSVKEEIADSFYFPTKKDDSDTMLSVKEGMKRGYKLFYIFGGTGGRCDHTLANIKLLEFLSENNCKGYLFFEKQVITVIRNGEIKFPDNFKGYFSVFPAGGKAFGVTIKGGEYEIFDKDLESSCSMGLSNDFKGREVTVTVKDGSLIIVFERQGEFGFGK